jgi:hypothetical protein
MAELASILPTTLPYRTDMTVWSWYANTFCQDADGELLSDMRKFR